MDIEHHGYGSPPTTTIAMHPEGIFPSDKLASPAESAAKSEIISDKDIAELVLDTLDHLAGASMREGFEKAIRTPHRAEISSRLKDPVEKAAKGVEFNKDGDMAAARKSYLKVYNLLTYQNADMDDHDFNDAFTQFQYLYGVGKDHEDTLRRRTNRDALRDQLEKITTK